MTWVICFNELDSPGHWNKFLNLASDWEKKLKAHTMCQSIVLGQREREKRKTCWIKTCQNISEWCIFGSRFVNDSSGFFQLSFLCLCRTFVLFVRAIWATMCARPGWGIEVSFVQRFRLYYSSSLLPMPICNNSHIHLTHAEQQISFAFHELLKAAVTRFKFLVSSAKYIFKGSDWAAWYGWGLGIWMRDWEERKMKRGNNRKGEGKRG